MLKRTLTFFANGHTQRAAMEPIYARVDAALYHKRWETQLGADADIGLYCAHQEELKRVGAHFAVIMLHDLGQRRDTWPRFWLQQPWDRFDLGLLPGTVWQQMYHDSPFEHRSRAPRYGVHVVGWPKADALFATPSKSAPGDRRTVLLQFVHPHVKLLNDLFASLAHLPLNLICVADAQGRDVDGTTFIPPQGKATLSIATHVDLPLPLLRQADLLLTDESSLVVEAAAANVPAVHLLDWYTHGGRVTPYPAHPFGMGIPLERADLVPFIERFIDVGTDTKSACEKRAEWLSNPGHASDATLACITQHMNDPAYTPAGRHALREYPKLMAQRDETNAILQKFRRVSSAQLLQHVGQRFDEKEYRERNPEIDAAVKQGTLRSGLLHWQHRGYLEGRHAVFGDAAPSDDTVKPAPLVDNYLTCLEEKRADWRPILRPRQPATKIVICSPHLSRTSGGPLVLHYLCQMMRDRGVDASLWLTGTSRADRSKPDDPYAPYANDTVDPRQAVVIYPEIINGNPLCGRHVVRWLLNRPGVLAINAGYQRGDLIMHYQPFCAIDPDPAYQLFIHKWRPPHLNPQIERAVKAFYIARKGHRRPRVALTENCLNADHKTPEELQHLFESHSHFYSYDIYTYYLIEAAACGAISVAIPDTGLTAQQWRQSSPLFNYGVAYGVDEIPWAEATRHLVPGHVKEIERTGGRQLDAFLIRLSSMGWWAPALDTAAQTPRATDRQDTSCVADEA